MYDSSNCFSIANPGQVKLGFGKINTFHCNKLLEKKFPHDFSLDAFWSILRTPAKIISLKMQNNVVLLILSSHFSWWKRFLGRVKGKFTVSNQTFPADTLKKLMNFVFHYKVITYSSGFVYIIYGNTNQNFLLNAQKIYFYKPFRKKVSRKTSSGHVENTLNIPTTTSQSFVHWNSVKSHDFFSK